MFTTSTILASSGLVALAVAQGPIDLPIHTGNFTLSTQSADGSVRDLNGAIVGIQAATYSPPQPLILLPTPNEGPVPPAIGYLSGDPDSTGKLSKDLSLFLFRDSNNAGQYQGQITLGTDPAGVFAVANGTAGAGKFEVDYSSSPNELLYAENGGFLGCKSADNTFSGYRLQYGQAGTYGAETCTAVKVQIHYH